MNEALMEINRYAHDLLIDFNNKHRTCYSCQFGINQGDTATSEINLYSGVITINLPRNKLNNLQAVHIEAYKILVGHLVAHHVYQRMIPGIRSSMLKSFGNSKALLESCCIECAADLHGIRLYTEVTGHRPSKQVILEYIYLISPSRVVDTLEYSLNCIKSGELPSFMRGQIIIKFKSFKTDNYAAVSDVAKHMNDVTRRALGWALVSREDVIKLRAEFDIDNFPNRVFRLGHR